MSELMLLNWKERASYVAGWTMLLTVAPLVACVVFATVLWEAIDRGFRGGFVESGHELSGVLMGTIVPGLDRLTSPINSLLVKHKEDAYIVNCAVVYGLGLPALLSYCGRQHLAAGSFSVLMCFAFHVLRMGPFFMNFAYVYATCHKEGHAIAAKAGLWRAPLDKAGPLRHIFNWWIGLYYGVMPSSFSVGHSINHHRYNNGPEDVVSTSDKPRDSAKALVCYLPRFALCAAPPPAPAAPAARAHPAAARRRYACNLSTIVQFCKQKEYRVAVGVLCGSIYYFSFFGAVAYLCAPPLPPLRSPPPRRAAPPTAHRRRPPQVRPPLRAGVRGVPLP